LGQHLTNVYDLKTGTLIWSGEGRSIVSLVFFFNIYGSKRTKQLQGICCICCDMWPALNTDMVTDNLHPPEFTDEIFKNCMEYAIRVNWGESIFAEVKQKS
jgi:hypothetical protein